MTRGGDAALRLHASVVAFAGRGVLVTGPSGSGKSALALQLMALGAHLVADDQVLLRSDGAQLLARAPAPVSGLIEARGVGLLRAEPLAQAGLVLAIDLSRTETERLPPVRHVAYLGLTLPLLHAVVAPYFPAAIAQYIKARGL